MDPAETHWQGPRTAAAASLHMAAAGQRDSVAWSRDRALEAREHTLAELWIPRRRIGKGPGQPPQLASTGRLRGSATQVAWSRDRAVEAREHGRRAVDPAETHWQGPRTAAAASLHKAAAGQGDSGRNRALEARLRSSKDLACWLASVQGGGGS